MQSLYRGTELNELSSSSSTHFLELELNLVPFNLERNFHKPAYKVFSDIHKRTSVSPQEELSAFRERLESLRSMLHSNRTVKPHPSPVPMMTIKSAMNAKSRKANGGAAAAAIDNAAANAANSAATIGGGASERSGKVYRRAMRMGGGSGGGGGGGTRKVSWSTGENDVQVAVKRGSEGDSGSKVAAAV